MAVKMMKTRDAVEYRLRAYILPRTPQTADQEEAFELACDEQAAWETAMGASGLPGGAVSYSNDGLSVTFAAGSAAPSYSKDTISPVAWSILRTAGLIAYALPTARKP